MLLAAISFSAAAALIVLLPGPDTLVTVRTLLRDGRLRAAQTVAGIICGLLIWVSAAALGLSAILRASQVGYDVLRIVGAVYLVWLGIQSLRARASKDDVEGGRGSLLGTGFVAGLATDLLNPKVGVFFVTFLPGFVPHGYSVGWTTFLFGMIFVVETMLYFALLLSLAGRVTRWMNNARIRRRLDRGTGVILIGLGARLALQP